MLDARTSAALGAAALACAARQPWRTVTIFDLASEAGLPLGDLAGATPGDALDAAEAGFDRAIARGLRGVDAEALVRDRLFDLIMRRFEAMETHRAALVALDDALGRDPGFLAAIHARHVRAARWILALAGVEADGVAGAARAQGLALLLSQVRATWREDAGGDFAKTMAALDRALRQAERTFGRFGGFERSEPAAKPQEPPSAASDPPPLAEGA